MTELSRPEMPTATGSCAGAESDSSTPQIVSNRTTRLVDLQCPSVASAYREMASRLSRLGSRLGACSHRTRISWRPLYRGGGWRELYWTYASHSAFLDGYEGTVEEAGIQYVRGNED